MHSLTSKSENQIENVEYTGVTIMIHSEKWLWRSYMKLASLLLMHTCIPLFLWASFSCTSFR